MTTKWRLLGSVAGGGGDGKIDILWAEKGSSVWRWRDAVLRNMPVSPYRRAPQS
jgi:hypothetical protein